jgi:hypothetical protein
MITGMKPKSAACRAVGSIPTSIAMPAMARALMPQSRSAKASGVPSKSRHGDLVKDGFARLWFEFGHEGEAGRVAQEPGFDLARIVDALPGHGHAVLKGAHELFRQRHVSGEEDAHTGGAHRLENLAHSGDDGVPAFYLALDADLHVVDQQRQTPWIADLFEGLRNVDAEGLFHGLAPQDRRGRAVVTPAATAIR